MRRIARISRTFVVASLLALPGVAFAQPTMERDQTEIDRRDRGFDFGWIGLLGLAGLAGLMGRDRTARYDRPATNRV
jgi:hypothetical protein